jgi:hypothetical protein
LYIAEGEDMRKEYAKLLRDSFTKHVKNKIQQFTPAKVKSQYL